MEEQDKRFLQAQEFFSVVYQESPVEKPRHIKAEVGTTVKEVVDSIVPVADKNIVSVSVNGKAVSDFYEPTQSDILAITRVPGIASAIGWAIAAAVAAVAVSFFLYKPVAADFASPELSENKQLARISGARNDARAYDVIPVVLGKRQVVPALQALPYTEIRGEDEWFKMLLCVGYGPLQIENIRIGDTAISEYEHRLAVLDHYQNKSLDSVRAIWPSDIAQESVNVTLANDPSPTIITRTAAAETDTVSVDFFFPRGIYRIDSSTGKELSRTVKVMHEYQDPSDDEWVIVAPEADVPVAALPFVIKTENGISHIKGYSGTDVASVTKTASSARQRRANITYNIANVVSPTNIRSRKISPVDTPDDSKQQDTVEWSVIRSIRNTTEQEFENLIGGKVPPRYINGVAVEVFKPVIIALEIKATDQLSGMIDNLNVDATSVYPSQWNLDWRDWYNLALAPSENPADAYRWLLQGPMNANPLANSRLDLDGLLTWRNRCAADGWIISSLIDYESTLMKELGQIAFTGRAEFGFVDGQYGVVEKIAKYTPVQVFTPKNTSGFSSTRNYPEQTDGIKFTFQNKDKDYQKDEDYFFDPALSPSERSGKFSSIDFWGVSDRDLAYKHARFAYYEQQLRREAYKINTDIEGMVAVRGDMVRLQHDVIDVGLGAGRIKAIDGNRVYLDETIGLPDIEDAAYLFNDTVLLFNSEDVYWNNGEDAITYGFQIRCSDGTFYTMSGKYIGDGQWVFSESFPVCMAVGDLIVYGELGNETLDCIVDQIEYGEDLSCSLTLLNAANEIFTYDDGTIPTFDSGLTTRPDYVTPVAPEFVVNLAGFDISRAVMYIQIGGVADINQVTGYQLQVQLVDPTNPDATPDWITYEIPQNASQFIVQGISRGETYNLRARTIGQNRTFSPYTDVSVVEVPEGLAAQNITGATFAHTIDGTVLSWDEATDADFQYYEIRTDTNFGSDTNLVTRTTSNTFNVGYLLGASVFYVSARTRFGTYSQTNTQISTSEPFVGTPTSLGVSLVRDTTTISWSAPSSNYSLKEYVITKNTSATGTGYENSVHVATINTDSYNLPTTDDGDVVYWVVAVDVAGNMSLPATNEVEITFPQTPIGLSTFGLFRNVQITWEEPSYFGHKNTQVYRATVNDINQAFPVGTAEKGVDYFVDVTEGGTTYYYWIRHVSVTDTLGNWSGVSIVTTPENILALKEDLLDNVDADMLAANAVVARNIAADAVTGDAIWAGSRIQIGNLDGVSDYVVLDSGSVESYKYIAGAHRLHKQLTRRESGTAASGSLVTLTGYWDSQPDIQVSPNTVVTFDPTYSNQRQTWSCRAQNVHSPSEGVWAFTAVANLELGDASGTTPVNTIQETSSNTYTSIEYTSPANTTDVEVHVNLKSVRGTGTSPNYYYRQVRWRVGYATTSSGPYTYTAYQTKAMGTNLEYVPDNLAIALPSSDTWYFVIEYIAEDAGGTFSTGAQEYEFDSATVTNNNEVSVQTINIEEGTKTDSVTLSLSYTVPVGWEAYDVDYTYDIAYWVYTFGSGSASISTPAFSRSVNQVFEGQTVQEGSSSLNNWQTVSSLNNVGFDQNFLTGNTGTNSQPSGIYSRQARAYVGLRNGVANIQLRRPVANSTTPSNGFRFDYYNYTLSSAQIISEGILNWIAVGS